MAAVIRIKPCGIPKVVYAQIISSPSKAAELARSDDCYLVSYVSEGKVTEPEHSKTIRRSMHDVFFEKCSRKNVEKPFHEHHTVCFKLEPPQRSATLRVGKANCTSENEVYSQDWLEIPEELNFTAPCELHRMIDEIIGIYNSTPDRQLKLGGLVLCLLDELSRSSAAGESRVKSKTTAYDHKAVEYIYANIHRQITQKEIAAHLGITPEYFSTVFKAGRGMTAMQFVNRAKLSGIRMLMATEGLKLCEAAERFGYSDPNYVSKLFKKHFGTNITSGIERKNKR